MIPIVAAGVLAVIAGGVLLLRMLSPLPDWMPFAVDLPLGWAFAIHGVGAAIAVILLLRVLPIERGKAFYAMLLVALCASFPVAGVLGAIGMVVILTRDTQPEDRTRFVLGNQGQPARRTSSGEVETASLASMMRKLDHHTLEQEVLSLRYAEAPEKARHVLSRCARDKDTGLQFAAHGVQSRAMSGLEEQLRRLRAQLAKEPENAENRRQAAAVAMRLARWLSPSDDTRNNLLEDAEGDLAEASGLSSSRRDRAECLLQLGRAKQARAVLDDGDLTDALALRFCAANGDWAELAKRSRKIQTNDPQLAAVAEFWSR